MDHKKAWSKEKKEIVGTAASPYIIVNDITGVSAADDWLLGLTGGFITKGGILIFG